MFHQRLLFLFGVLAGLSASPLSAAESIYTDLTIPPCKALTADKETGATTHQCPGVGGYQLLNHYDDERESLSVVAPNGKEHPLNFWNVITRGFSHLGKKVEWRATGPEGKKVPSALIVRVNARSDKGPTSYLAVAKIMPEAVCVTDRIEPTPKANEIAREKADQSASRPCLQPIP